MIEADAICDIDDALFHEGIELRDERRWLAWRKIVDAAERVAVRVTHRRRPLRAKAIVDTVCDKIVEALENGGSERFRDGGSL
jgi:hypothetical protein